mmetsp:Transcript_106890/g.310272  ORF Transcript_106890/g.310272 Transcript_106890/m.310272 type:complete len:87 (-) Transcript_106890:985-1245(-)
MDENIASGDTQSRSDQAKQRQATRERNMHDGKTQSKRKQAEQVQPSSPAPARRPERTARAPRRSLSPALPPSSHPPHARAGPEDEG